jgi:ABC-type nitrate/sulfonate/bicarbonate transport system ATPase subunit
LGAANLLGASGSGKTTLLRSIAGLKTGLGLSSLVRHLRRSEPTVRVDLT